MGFKFRKRAAAMAMAPTMTGIHPGSSVAPVPTRTAERSILSAPTHSWGWLPTICLLCACGLLLTTLAFNGSRAGAWWAETLFWASLSTIVSPIAWRLMSESASRRERLGLTILLGLSLYAVKVLHSPLAFTFSDELVHVYNVEQILASQRLMGHDNPIIVVTPLYPGLATVTSVLVSLSGLSAFSAGILVIGTARLVVMLALFLLWEHISASPRVAGIAALLYVANSNFVFWSAQFAYESLALPLATLVIFAAVRRESMTASTDRIGLSLIAILALLAVVMTHHLTAYALVAFLIVAAALYRLYGRDRLTDLTGIALLALLATITWLLYLASRTVNYLSPVLGNAVGSLLELIISEGSSSRQLFRSSTGVASPLWEQAFGIASVALIILGLPFGMWQIWRRHRGQPLVVLLSAATLTYFGFLAFRLTGPGWETANRSSAYLYIGIGLVLAIGFVEFWRLQEAQWFRRLIFISYVLVVFFGGVIAGWSPNARMAQPYLIDGEQPIEPQGVSAATWMRDYLGADNRLAADQSNARLMLAYGDQYPITGTKFGVQAMMQSKWIGPSTREIIQNTNIRYLIVDRRRISWNNMIGLYFNRTSDGDIPGNALFDPQVYTKFDREPFINKLLDTGNIGIYDVGVFANVPQTQ